MMAIWAFGVWILQHPSQSMNYQPQHAVFQCLVCCISVSELGNLSLYKLKIYTIHLIDLTLKFPFLGACVCLRVFVYMCTCRHASFHAQRVDKRASSTKSIVHSQLQIAPITPVRAKFKERIPSWKMNSQHIHMQERCISYFTSFRRLRYQTILSLLTPQYCAARIYICFKAIEK